MCLGLVIQWCVHEVVDLVGIHTEVVEGKVTGVELDG